MKDLSHNISVSNTLINAVKTTGANGTTVDLQGFDSATAVVTVGAEGDTLAANLYFTVALEHSDDNSTWTKADQVDIVNGTIAGQGVFLILDGTTGGNPGTTGGEWQVGYVGGKRYVRMILAKSGTHSTGTPISGVIVKGSPLHAPASNVIHNV
tara:strand:+ start:581 stop:1042 length:462 start_codon:yes stop_codon:yes gene_type:complete